MRKLRVRELKDMNPAARLVQHYIDILSGPSH